MASCKSPWWHLFLTKWTPFLFRRCRGYNMHWRWDRFCSCIAGENGNGVQIRVGGDYWANIGEAHTREGWIEEARRKRYEREWNRRTEAPE